jgi:hypothetical protein
VPTEEIGKESLVLQFTLTLVMTELCGASTLRTKSTDGMEMDGITFQELPKQLELDMLVMCGLLMLLTKFTDVMEMDTGIKSMVLPNRSLLEKTELLFVAIQMTKSTTDQESMDHGKDSMGLQNKQMSGITTPTLLLTKMTKSILEDTANG